mgnify:FL=1
MLKKIIAAVLSVLTALCLALPAFAVRNINDTDSTYESTTAGAGLRESELEKYTFTIDGLNDNALYYEKLLSFVALGDDGEEYPVTVWVEKESPNSYVLLLTDEEGEVYHVEGCIQACKQPKLNSTETYTLIFSSSELAIETPERKYRDYTLMSDISKFEEITIINKKVKKIASPVQSSETDAEPVTGAIQASGTTVGNNEKTKSVVSTTATDKDNDGGSVSKSTMITIVVLVLVLVIVLIVLAVCILCRGNVAGIKKIFKNILSKGNKQPAREKQPHKKKNSEQPQPNDRSKIEPNYRSKALPPNIEASTPKRTAKSGSNIEVPVNNAPKPIEEKTVADNNFYDNSGSFADFDAKNINENQKSETAQKMAVDLVNKIYSGDLTEGDLAFTTAFVGVSNRYQLSVNADEKVKFKVQDSKNSAAYVAIDSNELYLNFRRYNKKNGLYAYNSIEKIERCFDIYAGSRKIRANGQNIVKIVPAKIHVDNREFVLDEKGKIYVEG